MLHNENISFLLRGVYFSSDIRHIIGGWGFGRVPPPVADPGFSVGGRRPRRGRRLPRRLRFENFVCRNEESGPVRGRPPDTPPRSANDLLPCISQCLLLISGKYQERCVDRCAV